MDELADLLGMNAVEVGAGHGSRAQSHQNQMMPFLSGSTKDGKLTSVETFMENSSYIGHQTNQSNLQASYVDQNNNNKSHKASSKA